MADVSLRTAGRAARITLERLDALNALTLDMIEAILPKLSEWAQEDSIDMLIIDASGDKAFCAGGDIANLYAAMTSGDLETPRTFWRTEYALNAALFNFPKPVASFLQGFTMGGGVGVGCHASHRIVGKTSQIALPECSIGLVPDVGSTLLLARAPGRLGEYLGLTGTRADAGTAILAGLADYFVPESDWPAVITTLETTGDWTAIDRAAQPAPEAVLTPDLAEINETFGGETLRDIWTMLGHSQTDFAAKTRKRLSANAPLAMTCAVELIHRARARDDIVSALTNEYRFVHRAIEQGDFREGIRAAIIDKDKSPKWAHDTPNAPSLAEMSAMLRPLGPNELKLETDA